jgi:hypothetical protein
MSAHIHPNEPCRSNNLLQHGEGTNIQLIDSPVRSPSSVLVCAVKGCGSKFETIQPLAEGARYVCSHHSLKKHLASIGRVLDPEKDIQGRDIRFQKHQFDKSLRRSVRPFGTSHIHRQGSPTGEGDESTEQLLQTIVQSLPKFFSIRTVTDYQSIRPETPGWVKTRDLISFVLNRLDEQESEELLRHKIPLWAALDHVILTEYYLQYRTDEEIFEQYQDRLKEEAAGKKRWTRSVNALKNRRLRLVAKGDAMFGTK